MDVVSSPATLPAGTSTFDLDVQLGTNVDDNITAEVLDGARVLAQASADPEPEYLQITAAGPTSMVHPADLPAERQHPEHGCRANETADRGELRINADSEISQFSTDNMVPTQRGLSANAVW
ncbi:hypothetical protein [Actinospica robiniae]|uniref:hypothetical protein n=1 Tax=Actinospica robiniae TaxID=304901 RepID=UPI000409BD63|nr:hypothetical protein [Actinospica robiniae]